MSPLRFREFETAMTELLRPAPRRRLSVRVFFAWYDMWVGAYYDRAAGALYICPLPMVVACFTLRPPKHDRPVCSAERQGAPRR